MNEQRSEKHEQARNSLPHELKPVFDDFVTDYRFAATKHHGSPFVSYIVLAEMVKAGWRLAAAPLSDRGGILNDIGILLGTLSYAKLSRYWRPLYHDTEAEDASSLRVEGEKH
jgi:hypothetical protein